MMLTALRRVAPLLAAAVLALSATDSSAEGTAAPDSAAAHPAPPVADSLGLARPDTLVAPAPASPRSGAPRRMRDSVTVLPPVDIEGARTVAPGRSSATTVRLQRAEVVRFLPGTAADALLALPGVHVAKTGPWASRIFMRGLGGDRVVVLMDGMRLNTVRGHGAMSSGIPIEWIQGVELLPGASSTLYGTDALAGVVNFVTHRNLFATTPTTALALAADTGEPGGLHRENLRLSFGSPSLGVELRGGLRRLEALHTPGGRVANSGDRGASAGARLAAAWRGAVLDYEHLHAAARDVGLPAFNDARGATGEYPLQGRDADRLELTVPGSGARPELRLLAGSQTLRTDFTETTVAERYVRGNFVGTTTTVAADRVRTRARALLPSLRLRGPVELRLLGELRREEAGGPRLTHVTVRDRAGNVTSESDRAGESVPEARRDAWAVGLLAADTLLGTRLEGGLRIDALRSRADSSALSTTAHLDRRDRRTSVEAGFSRRAGVLEPYGRIATGFRSPNLEERYYNNDIHGGMRLFGNPALVAERSRVVELGMRLAEGASGAVPSARLSAYRSDVDDLVSFRYIDQLYGIPRFQYVNVRRARIEGLEAEGRVHLDRLALRLSGSFPRGKDLDTGERLADLGTARAALDVMLPIARLLPQGRLATRVLWNGAIRGDAALARPAFTVISAEASCVVAGVRAVLAVENLADHSYREPVSFIDSPGRLFTFALRRDFTLRHGGERR